MRKTTAILLTALLFINLLGYRLIFHFAEETADAKLEARLDNFQYDENELIAVAVPLSNPYSINQSDFERVDGEITVGNTLYKYVKRRVFNGELILLCIPNKGKMQIADEKKNYFANIIGITNDSRSKMHDRSETQIVKNPVTEYEELYNFYAPFDYKNLNREQRIINSKILPSVDLPVNGKPPQIV